MNRYKLLAACLLGLAASPGFAADSFFYWVGGDDTWFDGNNWFSDDDGSTGFLPANDAVWVNNGGTANANALDGSLAQISRFNIGSADPSTPGPDPTGTSRLNLVGLNATPATELRVGYNDQGVQSSFTGELFVTNGFLRTTEERDAQVGVAIGNLGGTTTTGVVNVSGDFSTQASIAFDDRNLLIGSYTGSTGQSGNAVGQVTVGQGIGGYANISVGFINSTGGASTANGSLTVSSGGLSPKLDFFDNGKSQLLVGTAFGAAAPASVVGAADITGDITGFTLLVIAEPEGTAQTSATGHVTLRNSHAQIGQVRMASKDTGTETAEATLTLNPSLLETDNLIMNEDATLTLHLEGLTRVTAGTAGDPDTYAAVDAVDALLNGVIVADFDFTPAAGSHSFDLITTDSLTALDDTAMAPSDFQIVGLDPGFSVDFFGVVEDGTDIVRLQISGAPIPEPASLALLIVGGATLLGRRRPRNASLTRTGSDPITG